jgi:hypothetical protein
MVEILAIAVRLGTMMQRCITPQCLEGWDFIERRYEGKNNYGDVGWAGDVRAQRWGEDDAMLPKREATKLTEYLFLCRRSRIERHREKWRNTGYSCQTGLSEFSIEEVR